MHFYSTISISNLVYEYKTRLYKAIRSKSKNILLECFYFKELHI